MDGGAIAVVSEQPTAYKITLDGDGQLDQAFEIDAIMPEGVVVEGHEIDISGRLEDASADPILESDPQWFLELEAVPRIGNDAELTGSSVIHYEESVSDAGSRFVEAVRVVEQGRRTTVTLADGSESTGCNFVSRNTVGRQVATALIEIAYDPQSCKRVVEFGVLSDADAIDSEADEADDSDSSAPAVSPHGSSGPTNAGGASLVDNSSNGEFRLEIPDYRVKTRSQVRELAYPLLPATSEVHAQVEVWNQNPQRSPSNWKWWSNWLSESGWRRTSHYAWSDYNSDYMYVGESSSYENPIFANLVCGGALPVPTSPGTTYAGHTVQTIGYANLTVDHYASNYKHGGCAYLLRTDKTDNFWWINRN
ncbi:hypothetical protein [Candidatus Poriferisodalis sp.]|uniref:hypothetical protein n=1 Tax=Candidatus Poriferisodalis sp. TaxID=3101277 RepID=UPI003B021CE7